MNHKNIKTANEWVNYVYFNWLDILNDGNPLHFHPSVTPLIKKLGENVSEENYVWAWHCIEQIQKLSEHLPQDSKISPRMLLECGIATLRMGHPRESIPFIQDAYNSYSLNHDKGVARWLLGCVYWHIDDVINALNSWENGCQFYKKESQRGGKGQKLALFYEKTIKDMEHAINLGSDFEEAPPTPPYFETSNDFSFEKKANVKRHTLQILPVIGQIPAGTPLNVLPAPLDLMNMEQVRINNKDYRIVSLLRGEKIVNLPQRGPFYYLLRVSGNSMNLCSPEPIEDGDYVILREQHTAENGDIVAAMIVKGGGEDNQATLKRYTIQDRKIFLHPESDDSEFQKPVYTNRIFNKLDDEFQIRGVAIAVLKPL